MFRPPINRLSSLLVLTCLTLAATQAQQTPEPGAASTLAPAAVPPQPAPPAAAAEVPPTPAPAPAVPAAPEPPVPVGPPPYDAKALKSLEYLLNQKFSREPADILHGLERLTADPATLTPVERFLSHFRTGNWSKLREEFARMPAELSRKLYDKILSDLTEKQKPNIKLEDVLNLADAVPGDYTGEELRKIGQLLSLAVPSTETYWLSDRLKKGTERLGGTEPTKRLLAGRVLLAGGFKELAREYFPATPEGAEKITDEGVRNEVVAFLASQREGESALRGQVQRIWEENLRTLVNPGPKVNDYERQRAGSALAKIIAQVPPTTLVPTLTELVKSNPEGAARLVSAVARKVATDKDADVAVRTENLRTQASMANLLTSLVDPASPLGGQISDMIGLMADFWSAEAERAFTLKSAAQPGQPAKWVSAEDLLATAPSGKWEAALSKPARDRLDVGMSKAILAGAEFDQAADRIVAIGQRNPAAGAALAEDFLGVWARTHNPQIPEPLRKKFDLPDDARIPVTPIMMEKNIESLARMMALFRQAGLAPSDYTKVVNAFDLAYSNAETYRTGHIEKVFGPLEKMDEPLFFLITSKMSANLGERWRKMDVQKAGMTKRDEAETLELVRSGYTTALQIIETWAKGHPESARALTLAGTILSEWGDFEYFQELVSSDARLRMTGYKEKNIQAGEHFLKATQVYAGLVPKLALSDYTVEPYLAWFHSLLGIGSNGQINLSKALNRAALGKIREQMLGLGERPGKAHISAFAKIVNARLNDEKEPLHEDLKYRYLASALIITKDDPFTLGAEKKVAYFDELLSEVRLQARVDGPNTIGRDQDFGIIVSIVHTEAMGRVAKFGQYLTNDTTQAVGNKPKKKSPLVKKMREAQGPRDELELNLTEKLSPFFDIRSITFATPDVKARPTSQPGWEETVLAYLQVHAKDASVDKIPPVELELKFVDLTGPVTIPAESAETVLKMATEGAPPRPATQVEITQTLDTRQLLINGALPLEIKATATGLVPDLEQLLDLEALKKQLAVKNINPHEGLQVKELNTWGDQVAPRSERLWTVALDGDAVRSAGAPMTFQFPQPKGQATAVYQTYSEMNLATLQEPKVEIGRALSPAEKAAQGGSAIWWMLGALVLGGVAAAIYFLTRSHSGAGEQALRARDVIKMPAQLDGFSVVALLRKLRTSPLVHLPETQKQELQTDLQRVQQSCFGSREGMSETDLRSIAEKWLRLAT